MPRNEHWITLAGKEEGRPAAPFQTPDGERDYRL